MTHSCPPRRSSELLHPVGAVWLLEQEGPAIGHAAAGPCGLPHPDVAPGDGELKRLYLLREHQNGGWGGKLFATALDWLQREGPRTLWIGVWSENVGAQRFYARHGFPKVGEYEFRSDGRRVGEEGVRTWSPRGESSS